MGLEQLVEPLRKVAWVCRPEDAPCATALDLVSDRANRWNEDGEKTIYLSGDPALALIESGRHPEDLQAAFRVLRLDLRLRRALDVRRPQVRVELELPAGEWWILDRERTRAIARRLRRERVCDALLVPSAGALDQDDRWNAVVFADDPRAVGALLGDPRPAGTIALDAAAIPSRKQAG